MTTAARYPRAGPSSVWFSVGPSSSAPGVPPAALNLAATTSTVGAGRALAGTIAGMDGSVAVPGLDRGAACAARSVGSTAGALAAGAGELPGPGDVTPGFPKLACCESLPSTSSTIRFVCHVTMRFASPKKSTSVIPTPYAITFVSIAHF
jgi:hypothetical protein